MGFFTQHACQLRSGSNSIETGSIDVTVEIVNSVARTTFIQTFKPPKQNLEDELCYLLPIADDFCVESFDVEVDKKVLKGLIKPKEEAELEYEKMKATGHRVGLATREEPLPGVVSVRLGQFKRFENLKVTISFLESLSVSSSKFWRYVFYSAVPLKLLELAGHEKIGDLAKGALFSLKVEIYSSSRITFVNSLTHKISVEYKNDQTHCIVKLPNDSQITHLQKNFEIIYRDESIGKPSYALDYIEMADGKRKYCAMVTFFPEFDKRPVDDVMQAQIAGETSLEFVNSKGEFIFLIDRSGSMEGDRIKNAQTALTFFVKSLPKDCYFNIVSFGSDYRFMFETSQKYSSDVSKTIISSIQKFSADMGGTQILEPLQKILEAPLIKNYPRRIFLVTDGDVSNADQIIFMIKKCLSSSMISCIGVGHDISNYLLSNIAKYGKGKASFVYDPEKIEDEVIRLLIQTNSPVLEQFKLTLDSELVDFVSPNPEISLNVRKEDIFKTYIFFNDHFREFKRSRVKLEYFDNYENKMCTHELVIELNDQSSENFISKLGVYDLAIQAHFEGQKVALDNILAVRQKGVDEIVKKLCVEHNVLSKHTAFLILEEQKPINVRESYDKRKNIAGSLLSKQLRSRSPPRYNSPRLSCLEYGYGLFDRMAGGTASPGYAGGLSGRMLGMESGAVLQRYEKNCNIISPAKETTYYKVSSPGSNITEDRIFFSKAHANHTDNTKDTILQSQTSEGFWETSKKLFDIVKIDRVKFEATYPPELLQKMNKDEIWMTIIMIDWINRQYGGSLAWIIVIKKAKDWISSQGVDFNKIIIPVF